MQKNAASCHLTNLIWRGIRLLFARAWGRAPKSINWGREDMNFIKNVQIFLAAVFFTAIAACSSAPTAEDYAARAQLPNNTVQSPAPSTTSSPGTPSAAAILKNQYHLGNGDRIRITVFGEPDLSGEFVVDGAGQISIPLIGEINAAGSSIRDLQRRLEAEYRSGYLNDPKISAEVVNYCPYYIMGEINRPGEYPYMSGLTVLNAVATAQGFTYRANKREVFIRSADELQERKVVVSSSLQVHPGDTIRIGERLF